jgi:hypothetical protein
LVEWTIPLSAETDYGTSDAILTTAGYQFVYFDGLNRFYVAKEHADLAEAFSCPPNVFDNVQLSGLANSELCRGLVTLHQSREKELTTQVEKLAIEVNAANEHNTRLQVHAEWLQTQWDATKQRVEELCQSTGRMEAEFTKLVTALSGVNERNAQLQSHAEWLQNEWEAAKVKIDDLNQSSHHWWTVADQLSRELQGVYASKSWRITWPLRKTMQVIKWVLALPMGTVQWTLHLPKRVAKPLVVWAMRKTLSNPRLKSCALNMLGKHPQLKLHLRQFAIRSGLLTGWSPRAARIYADLKRACEGSKS